MIYITGDTHGDVIYRCEKLMPFLNKKEDNYIIICGDFGLIWGKKPAQFEWEEYRLKEEEKQIKEIAKLPVKVLFVDGNHECFDRLNNEFSVIDFHGGKAHQISDNIFHLMRGEMYDIEDNSIFAFGGARSHDIWNLLDPESKDYWDKVDELRNDFYRTIGETWWEDEIATEDDFKHGYETLEKNNWECDYIISHEAPKSDALFLNRDGGVMCDYFEAIKQAATFKRWFFGHHHMNLQTSGNAECIYYGFSTLDDFKTLDKLHKGEKNFSKKKLSQIINKSKQERKNVLTGKYQKDTGM